MKKATILAAVIIAMFVASCGNGTNSATATKKETANEVIICKQLWAS